MSVGSRKDRWYSQYSDPSPRREVQASLISVPLVWLRVC
jgi:hypothetical protein